MAKLIPILAASFGGGLVLGAGIRIGEALANGKSDRSRKPARHLNDPDALMARRMEEQAAEVSAIRAKLTAEARQVEALGELGTRLQKELPEWIERSVARRIEEAEAALKAECGRSQKEALETIVESVQTRVAHRISRLEEEVSMHSAAMTELRACSLRTEAGIEKLAGSLERLLDAQVSFRAQESSATDSAARQTKEPAAAPEERPARSRRGIFG